MLKILKKYEHNIYNDACRSSTDTALQNIMINELLISFEVRGIFDIEIHHVQIR
jgi:hypothetical protein